MDKKLTDNEIIKALPNMTYGGHYCLKCKYDNGKGNDRCGLKGCKIARYALDLITRQQAEKEALIAGQETLQKYIAQQKNEIERLKQIVGFTPARGSRKSPLLNAVLDNVRAEAYREFAEVLKKKLYIADNNWHPVVCEEEIDEALKELEGEDDG